MSDWTKEERAWLWQFARLISRQPDDIVLCTTDGEITACKRGVPSREVHYPLPGAIKGGLYLTDVHDDCDCNR